MVTLLKLTKAKLELDVLTATKELQILHNKYDMGKEWVKALVWKHHEWLNQKVKDAQA